MGQNFELSARERQVLQLVAYGRKNKAVAIELGISLETAKSHIKHILGKLCAHSRAHAVAIGMRRGLIS
jgi:two-component system, NarL family, response regulator